MVHANHGLDVLEFLALVEEEFPGPHRRHDYVEMCDNGYRFGQAFMNVLRGTSYYDELTGSLYDPFYKYDYTSVLKAIDFVCSKKYVPPVPRG